MVRPGSLAADQSVVVRPARACRGPAAEAARRNAAVSPPPALGAPTVWREGAGTRWRGTGDTTHLAPPARATRPGHRRDKGDSRPDGRRGQGQCRSRRRREPGSSSRCRPSAGPRARSRSAPHAGRREALDRPATVPARPQLLHAAARARGAAARDLRRLAPQRTRGGLVAGSLFVLPGSWPCLRCPPSTWPSATRWWQAVFAGLAPAVLAVVVQAVSASSAGRSARTLWSWPWSASSWLTLFSFPFPSSWPRRARRAGVGRSGPALGQAARVWRRALATGRRASMPRRRGAPVLQGPRSARSPRRRARLWAGGRRRALRRHRQRLHRARASSSPARRSSPSAGLRRPRLRRPAGGRGLRVAPPRRDGARLALAETTPGPLIMVVQFVAFLGAYRHAGALDPWVAAASARCSSPG